MDGETSKLPQTISNQSVSNNYGHVRLALSQGNLIFELRSSIIRFGVRKKVRRQITGVKTPAGIRAENAPFVTGLRHRVLSLNRSVYVQESINFALHSPVPGEHTKPQII